MAADAKGTPILQHHPTLLACQSKLQRQTSPVTLIGVAQANPRSMVPGSIASAVARCIAPSIRGQPREQSVIGGDAAAGSILLQLFRESGRGGAVCRGLQAHTGREQLRKHPDEGSGTNSISQCGRAADRLCRVHARMRWRSSR